MKPYYGTLFVSKLFLSVVSYHFLLVIYLSSLIWYHLLLLFHTSPLDIWCSRERLGLTFCLGYFGGVSEKQKNRSDTWCETHLPRGIMTPTDKATADSRSVHAVLRILLLAVYTLELEMDCPSETSPCTVGPLPHRHPFSDFFWGDGAAVHRLSWNG